MTDLPFSNANLLTPAEERPPDRPPSFYEFTPTPPNYRCEVCLEVFERKEGPFPGDPKPYREMTKIGDAWGNAEFVPTICDNCHGKSRAATNPWQHIVSSPNFQLRLLSR